VKETYPHPHTPVLLQETLTFFDHPIDTFIDATTGMGGHAEAILSAHPEIRQWYAIDRDQEALAYARQRLSAWAHKIQFIHANYSQIREIAERHHVEARSIDGILADLGVSSLQLDTSQRGFSFSLEGPLDMRMDQSSPITAASILAEASQQELERILRDYGEESRYRKVAERIVEARQVESILTTKDLERVLAPLFPARGKLNPLTLIFQGLRIAVNSELEGIEQFLRDAPDLLKEHGRMGVIAFHSLEDRPVKQCFQSLARDRNNRYSLYNKHVIVPAYEETKRNPRSRSSRMRGLIATKVIKQKKYPSPSGEISEHLDT
jgi:16S rRNA (cytosine1402-N4)-methyltransferase